MALAALCTVLACMPAGAQSPALVDLAWSAPHGCPSAADVQARIRKLLPAPGASASPTATALAAEATITRKQSGGLQLKLVIRAGDLTGERVITGRSCEDLAGAAAVNLALLLGSREPLSPADVGAPLGASGSAEGEATPPGAVGPAAPEPGSKSEATPTDQLPAKEGQPTRDASPSARAQPDQPTAGDASSARTWRGLLDLPLASLELGPLSQPSLGGALAAGLWLDRWRILAEGTLWLRQKLSVTTPLPAGANVDRIAATLRMCRTYPFGRFELAPCLHLSLQHVSARGTGPHIEPRTEASTWVAPGVGVQARFQLTSWLGLLGSADAAIESARPRIAVEGVGRVGQLGPAALKIALGLEWIL